MNNQNNIEREIKTKEQYTSMSEVEELQTENGALKDIISDMKEHSDELELIIAQKNMKIAYLRGLVDGIGGK